VLAQTDVAGRLRGCLHRSTDRRRRLDADDPPRPGLASDESRSPGAAWLRYSGERSLAGLFMMLASSAVVALGHAPDPLTGQRQTDLVQAADAIDLLVLLQREDGGAPVW